MLIIFLCYNHLRGGKILKKNNEKIGIFIRNELMKQYIYGKNDGNKEALIKIIKRLYQKDISIEEISEITDININNILKIVNQKCYEKS